ncbi:MAG TPA: hypothetical protein VK892_03045, partial [Pyrinomonadaceae bacterium]|nr:hypothetical protein [Pyrinomonadaceae bacterium]
DNSRQSVELKPSSVDKREFQKNQPKLPSFGKEGWRFSAGVVNLSLSGCGQNEKTTPMPAASPLL